MQCFSTTNLAVRPQSARAETLLFRHIAALEKEVLARDAGALLLARDGDTPALHQQAAAQARQVLERVEVDALTPSQTGKIEGGGDAACKGEAGAGGGGGGGGGDLEAPRMLVSSLCPTNFSQQYTTNAALRHESLVPGVETRDLLQQLVQWQIK